MIAKDETTGTPEEEPRREPFSADDFQDKPPNRAESRRLLEEASGDVEKIKAWNRLMDRHLSKDWHPDISDGEDPWNPRNGLVLSIANEEAEEKRVAINLSLAKLDQAVLANAHLEGANLRHAYLERASLTWAHLEGANLDHANLAATELNSAHLDGARLSDAILNDAQLLCAQLDRADLSRASLKRAELTRAQLNGTNLKYAHLEQANLNGADLEGAVLIQANLDDASLGRANLEGAYLTGAHLERADLIDANLRGAELVDANLQRSKCVRANLKKAVLVGAHFEGAEMYGVLLEGANLSGAHFDGADLQVASFGVQPSGAWVTRLRVLRVAIFNKVRPVWRAACSLRGMKWLIDRFVSNKSWIEKVGNTRPNTILDNADLRDNSGFIPNGQSARGVRFRPAAKDPYSIVRRKYTGPLMLFNLVFLALFFTPYVIRAGAWTAASRIQSSMAVDFAEASNTVPRSVAMIVLGFRPGLWGTFAGILSILFILYNVLRGIVTWRMSQVRDAEERSDHLPEVIEYWWCYSLHTYILRWIFWGAVMSFLYHAGWWMLETVDVPLNSGQ